MSTYRIETNEQLMEFISNPNVTIEQAREVTSKFLKTIIFEVDETKEEFYLKIAQFIERFSDSNCERPMFIE